MSMPVPASIDKSPTFDPVGSAANALRAGEASPRPTVREFLLWFGAYRRGYIVVRRIRKTLARAGVQTVPDFESAYIDSKITFVLLPGQEAPEQLTPPASSPEKSAEPVSIGIADPTNRVGKLPAANRVPVSVTPGQTLRTAISLMLSYDYSQLPVLVGERTVKGMVTWRSIALRWALKSASASTANNDTVECYMEEAPEISADRSLFAAIPTIISSGFILVRDANNKVGGIVTASDLSEQFQQLAEPFLLIGEIEGHIRRLLDGAFTKEELSSVKEAGDTRSIESVADLTFGQYVRLLEDPAKWPKLELNVERPIFTKQLDEVRRIRNDVMHFDPDPFSADDLATLRRFAKFLQTLQTLGL